MYRTTLLPQEAKIAVASILIYVSIYSLEAPIRYILALTGLIEIILFRDLLIIGPIVYIGIRQALDRQVNLMLLTLAFLLVAQGTVFYLNFHVVGPILLGAKLLLNIALGFMVGALFTDCSARTFRTLTLLFVVTCVGLFVEKFVTRFPWVGMTTVIGGVDVPVSFDWKVDEGLGRRVGGFTRLSIAAADLVPFLAFIVIPKLRSLWLRAPAFLLATVSVWLTTQKGALIAVALVSGALLLPGVLRYAALRIAVLSGAAAQIILPFATADMPMSEGAGDGILSAASFAARVLYTWPGALKFISENAIGVFGTGIGSLGGPVRLFMQSAGVEMYADNMFIFVYGYFGIFAAFFYWAIIYAVWRSLRLPSKQIESALALLAFLLWYGVVITGIEGQITSLALGLSLGCLLTTPVAPIAVGRPGQATPGKSLVSQTQGA